MQAKPVDVGPAERTGRSADTTPSDRELLAAMLSTNGHGQVLAERLLSRFGSAAAIARAIPADLTLVEGIGLATARRLTAAFQLARRAIAAQPPARIASRSDIVDVVAPLLHGRTRERLVAVICNRIGRVVGFEIICEGSADGALLPAREVMVAVLRRDGLAFALAHNHPSGDPTPSRDDVRATRKVWQAAIATGLQFLGHVVLTDSSWQTVPNYIDELSLPAEQMPEPMGRTKEQDHYGAV